MEESGILDGLITHRTLVQIQLPLFTTFLKTCLILFVVSVETLVFDHSGTLSNDFSIVLCSCNNILRIFGRPQITEVQYRADFGNDIVSVYKKWGVDASFEKLNEIHARFLNSQPRPEPIPFAVETVKTARRLVKKIVSFSAHPTEELRQDLRDWGIYGYFDAVYGNVRKHLDTDFKKMLEKTGARRETTLYVGDTTVDIELAKRNNIRCAVVLNRKYCYQNIETVRLHNPKADFCLDDISEIVPLLKRL